LPHTVAKPDLVGKEQRAGRLLRIRVERWDTVRFSGLLGLQKNAAGLQYVVLDATGVKLLEVAVAGDGSDKVLRLSGVLKDTDFAPFLSEALARIYLQEVDGIGCIGSWFYQVCREESEDKGWVKFGQAGPFKVWQMSTGAEAEAVVYRQPWLGLRIYLEPTKLSP
jgi:hypothetical protein